MPKKIVVKEITVIREEDGKTTEELMYLGYLEETGEGDIGFREAVGSSVAQKLMARMKKPDEKPKE